MLVVIVTSTNLVLVDLVNVFCFDKGNGLWIYYL